MNYPSSTPPPSSPPPPPPPRRGAGGRGCLTAVLLAMVFAVGTIGLVLGLSAYVGAKIDAWPSPDRTAREAGIDEAPALREIWSAGDGDVKVVRIPLEGMISLGESGWNAVAEGSAAFARQSIRKATHDPEVRALLLEVNSGGGGITASDVIFRELRDFRNSETGRVVVVHMGDVAASGAYYIAVAADWILAHPTTLTGSIGVLMQSLNLRELGEKIGVHDITIKSGANKDLLNPLGEMTPEQRAMLQGIIDAMHARFVGLVAEERGLPRDRVEGIADGRILLAGEALELALIDEIGYHDSAVAKLCALLGTDRIRLYRYQPRVSLMDFFRRPALFGGWLRQAFHPERTRLLYRWSL